MKRYYYTAAVALSLMSTVAIASNTASVQSTTMASSIGSGSRTYAAATTTIPGGVEKSATSRNAWDKDSYWRIALAEVVAKGTSYDQITPYKVERYETVLLLEYFRSKMSFGIMPIFLRVNTAFKALPASDYEKSAGLVPFANYLFAPSWLATVQAGYYYENHNWRTQQFAGGPANLDWRQQAHRYFGAGYVTWIGPQRMVTGSIRAGTSFQYSKFMQAFDALGRNNPASNFQRGAVSLSGRLKYSPADAWELYFQTEVDYSYRVTRRDSEFRKGGGRQSIRFVAGPGVNYNPSATTEVSMAYNSVQGWGYYRENQIILRLRMLV
ncbi:MAG: hypothetical protein WCG04_06435 [Alphaproteobacteria bacterium]